MSLISNLGMVLGQTYGILYEDPEGNLFESEHRSFDSASKFAVEALDAGIHLISMTVDKSPVAFSVMDDDLVLYRVSDTPNTDTEMPYIMVTHGREGKISMHGFQTLQECYTFYAAISDSQIARLSDYYVGNISVDWIPQSHSEQHAPILMPITTELTVRVLDGLEVGEDAEFFAEMLMGDHHQSVFAFDTQDNASAFIQVTTELNGWTLRALTTPYGVIGPEEWAMTRMEREHLMALPIIVRMPISTLLH